MSETGALPGRRRWIVDPLDGTTNFLRGIAHWAVSIALEEDGRLVLGVVHDPLKDETFSARTGGGLYLNDTPLAAVAPPGLLTGRDDGRLMCVGVRACRAPRVLRHDRRGAE